jgi:hypothetical protein
VRVKGRGGAKKAKPSEWGFRGFERGSLTMTYFRKGSLTIIGAVVFHGPVRDGKGWFQDAVFVRQKGGRKGIVCFKQPFCVSRL